MHRCHPELARSAREGSCDTVGSSAAPTGVCAQSGRVKSTLHAPLMIPADVRSLSRAAREVGMTALMVDRSSDDPITRSPDCFLRYAEIRCSHAGKARQRRI